ncbi:MAG: hypothetical protein ACR2NZ_08235 [Rubripirellula sp.]
MSEPAIFVLIRDGDIRYFQDRFANVFLFRDLLWGPEALERWLSESDEIDDWTDDVVGGVVADIDRRRLMWHGDDEMLRIPRKWSAYEKLLQAAWPGFEIGFATRGLRDLAAAAGESDAADYEDETPARCETVNEAAGFDSDELDDDPEDMYDDEDERAWVTVVDDEGVIRHRNLQEISEDLIDGRESALRRVLELPPGDLPRESAVIEGMWIDEPRQEIGLWGGPRTRRAFGQMNSSWDGYAVMWADDGYSQQCAVSGPEGIPMTEAEALGAFLPTVLSTKRFDLASVFNAVGGQLKKTAAKATGCFVGLICTPVLLFGAISGSWKAVFITVGIVVLFFVIVFKVVELRFKKKFAVAELASDGEEGERPAVVGPLNEQVRRQELDGLLQRAGLPSIAEIEPHFASESIEDLL